MENSSSCWSPRTSVDTLNSDRSTEYWPPWTIGCCRFPALDPMCSPAPRCRTLSDDCWWKTHWVALISLRIRTNGANTPGWRLPSIWPTSDWPPSWFSTYNMQLLWLTATHHASMVFGLCRNSWTVPASTETLRSCFRCTDVVRFRNAFAGRKMLVEVESEYFKICF